MLFSTILTSKILQESAPDPIFLHIIFKINLNSFQILFSGFPAGQFP